jgi:hypothetical protein
VRCLSPLVALQTKGIVESLSRLSTESELMSNRFPTTSHHAMRDAKAVVAMDAASSVVAKSNVAKRASTKRAAISVTGTGSAIGASV